MAQINAVSGNQLKVAISDGGTPETFAHRCQINSDRAFALTASTIRDSLPDCADLDAASWQSSQVDTLSADISGSGRLDVDDIEFYYNWMTSAESKKIRFQVGADGGYFEGLYTCTNFSVTGPGKQLATVAISFESNGVVTYTPAD